MQGHNFSRMDDLKLASTISRNIRNMQGHNFSRMDDVSIADYVRRSVKLYSGLRLGAFLNDYSRRNRESRSSTIRRLNNRSQDKNHKRAESSQRSANNFFCIICMDKKPNSENFRNRTCKHVFCSDCIAKHVQARIQENNSKIGCPYPKCQTLLDPTLCRSILPRKVFNRWTDALCEAQVPATQKFYCPFKDCSAMLINDGSGGVVTASECPHCSRLFCAQCKVKWHAGLSCSGFRKSKKGNSQIEDMMVMELAKRKKWMRCPKCKFFVERKSGCLHISCRCGCQFCYKYGSLFTSTHRCA